MEVAFSSAFKRAFKKLVKGRQELERTFWSRVEIFIGSPYDVHRLQAEIRQVGLDVLAHDQMSEGDDAEGELALVVLN